MAPHPQPSHFYIIQTTYGQVTIRSFRYRLKPLRRNVNVQVFVIRDGEAAIAERHIARTNVPKARRYAGRLSVFLI